MTRGISAERLVAGVLLKRPCRLICGVRDETQAIEVGAKFTISTELQRLQATAIFLLFTLDWQNGMVDCIKFILCTGGYSE